MALQVGHGRLHAIDRNREADVLRRLLNGLVDADHLTVHVDERAARVARIDRRRGLHQALELARAPDRLATDGQVAIEG